MRERKAAFAAEFQASPVPGEGMNTRILNPKGRGPRAFASGIHFPVTFDVPFIV
jgi:voltage-gated potassium channel Kch